MKKDTEELHRALFGEKWNDAIKILENGKPNLEERDEYGLTAIQILLDMYARNYWPHGGIIVEPDSTINPSFLNALKALIDAGADVHAFFKEDDEWAPCTPLGFALTLNWSPVVEILVNAGADMYFESINKTIVNQALTWSCFDAVSKAVQLGYNINHQDSEGNTLLHWAHIHFVLPSSATPNKNDEKYKGQYGAYDFVMDLEMPNGIKINPFLKNNEGMTAMDQFIESNYFAYEPLEQYMKQYGPETYAKWVESRARKNADFHRSEIRELVKSKMLDSADHCNLTDCIKNDQYTVEGEPVGDNVALIASKVLYDDKTVDFITDAIVDKLKDNHRIIVRQEEEL